MLDLGGGQRRLAQENHVVVVQSRRVDRRQVGRCELVDAFGAKDLGGETREAAGSADRALDDQDRSAGSLVQRRRWRCGRREGPVDRGHRVAGCVLRSTHTRRVGRGGAQGCAGREGRGGGGAVVAHRAGHVPARSAQCHGHRRRLDRLAEGRRDRAGGRDTGRVRRGSPCGERSAGWCPPPSCRTPRRPSSCWPGRCSWGRRSRRTGRRRFRRCSRQRAPSGDRVSLPRRTRCS